MAIASINPATGEKVKEFAQFDDTEIEKRLKGAENASRKYRRTAFSQRSELLEATAELLLLEKDRLAEIITLEMGKLFRASVEEIVKCARGCRFYAENAERFLEDEPAQTDAARSYVHYEPLGPVLAIMPWNFPFWQLFRFAGPGLMAGSDAFIVMPSADFESALSTAVKARTINTGQSCIAAKRLFIADEIYDEFLDQFVDRMRALKIGDPMDPATEIGPLATEQILQG